MKLKDKVAIITGGGAGIGKALALGLAKEGADIVITDVDDERVKKAEADLKALGVKVLALKSDVSVVAEIQDMVEKVIQEFGKIDILINNAGIGPVAPFLQKDEATFDRVIAVNQKGVFFCTQAVARHMAEKKYGKIIGIASSHGRVGIPMNVEYAGTKGAMIAMTRAMAAELSPMGINVNAIACGLTTDTEQFLASGYPQEAIDQIAQMSPLRRTASIKDYVGIAVFLASDDSSFVTGQTISVDGGVSMP